MPIVSFLIKNEISGLYLHHKFVTKLLNDLFGIQVRSGCACAGPYAEYLLGINEQLSERYITSISHRNENSARKDWESNHIDIMKPGFTRFNLPFFFDESKVEFILEAIEFVCHNGWKFLPQYNFCIETGKFTHVINTSANNQYQKLNLKQYLRNKLKSNNKTIKSLNETEEVSLYKCLEDAKSLADSLELFYGVSIY